MLPEEELEEERDLRRFFYVFSVKAFKKLCTSRTLLPRPGPALVRFGRRHRPETMKFDDLLQILADDGVFAAYAQQLEFWLVDTQDFAGSCFGPLRRPDDECVAFFDGKDSFIPVFLSETCTPRLSVPLTLVTASADSLLALQNLLQLFLSAVERKKPLLLHPPPGLIHAAPSTRNMPFYRLQAPDEPASTSNGRGRRRE